MLFSGAHSGNNCSDYSLFNKPILYANITATKLLLCFFFLTKNLRCVMPQDLLNITYSVESIRKYAFLSLPRFFYYYYFLPQERVTTPDSPSIFTVGKYQKFILSNEYEMPPNVCVSNSKSIPSVHRWNHNDRFRYKNKKNIIYS